MHAHGNVAITGIGIVSAAGSTPESFWETIVGGRVVARAIQRVDMSESPVGFGCEVTDFEAHTVLSPKEARRADRVTQFTLSAADAAFRDAGSPEVDPARVATVIGSGFGGLETADDGAREFLGVKLPALKGRINPLFIPMVMPNASAAAVSLRHGFRGPSLCISTACAAGAHAIGEGMRLLREGSADLVVAGGAEAPLTPWVLTGFAAAQALSRRESDPGAASRPFDRDRDGFVMGEGAAVVVLERIDDARGTGCSGPRRAPRLRTEHRRVPPGRAAARRTRGSRLHAARARRRERGTGRCRARQRGRYVDRAQRPRGGERDPRRLR